MHYQIFHSFNLTIYTCIMKRSPTILMLYSHNNVILRHPSMKTTPMIHHLLHLVYQFVLHALSNTPWLQFYHFHMHNEAEYSHPNVILSHPSITAFTMIHRLLYFSYQFVLRTLLNIPWLQFCQVDMHDEAESNHTNVIFI